DLMGKTNSSLFLSNVAFADAGGYTVVAYNISGSVTSSVATLTVTAGTPPSIITQPQDQTVDLMYPSNTVFYVYATGSAPLSYQWYHNGTLVISNGTYSSLNVFPRTSADLGDYFVVVSNGSGSVTSVVARLTLSPYTV